MTPDPAPSLEQWRARVDQDRRGRPFDELLWRPDPGSRAPPLFTRRDLEDLPHLAVREALAAPAGWAVRERIAAASPELAAEQARHAVADGVAELELRIDTGLLESDPDEPDLCGVPVGCAEDLATALAPVDLERTAVCFDGDALLGLAFLLVHAGRRGIAPERLRGELGFDPLEGIQQLDQPALTDTRWREAGALLAWCAEHAPGLRPLGLHSRGYHEAGASAAQELACILAEAIETVRQLGLRGHPFSRVAAGLGFRVPVSSELLVEIAKMRALRLLWAKVAAAFLPDGEAVPAVPVVAYSSERSRARRYDLRTNLVRGSLEAIAAVVGGCDALCLEPYEPHPDHQDETCRRLARHQHHLLREESWLGRVADPAAGSYAVERLTHDLASRAWGLLVEIEAAGGMRAALHSGFVARRVLRAGMARLARLRRREQVRIGINRYVDPELEGERRRLVDRAACVAASEERLAARSGGEEQRARALAELAAADEAALVQATVRAAEAGCAGFEITEVLESTGEPDGDELPEDLPVSPEPEDVAPDLLVADPCDFEDLRALAEEEAPPRALVLVVGEGPAARHEADFAADLLRAAGFRAVPHQVDTDPASAARAARDQDAELVVLCGEDADDDATAAALERVCGAGERPVLAAVGPRPTKGAAADAYLVEGTDLLLRVDYLFKLVELRRAAHDETAEIRHSLEDTLAVLRDCIEREERGR